MDSELSDKFEKSINISNTNFENSMNKNIDESLKPVLIEKQNEDNDYIQENNNNAESVDDSQEFVEASNTFYNADQNNDDKLIFKDAKEELFEDAENEKFVENSDCKINPLNFEEKNVLKSSSNINNIENELDNSNNSQFKSNSNLNKTIDNVVIENKNDSIKSEHNIETEENDCNNVNKEEKNLGDVETTKNFSSNVEKTIEDNDNQDNGSQNFENEDAESDEQEIEESEEELDEDEIKSSPAYIPKRGQFYMHDLRNGSSSGGAADDESCTGAENNNDVTEKKVLTNLNRPKLSRADRKWEHDLFDDKKQRPKTSKELIRRYGKNIRVNNKNTNKNFFLNKNKKSSSKEIVEDSGEIDDENDDESAIEFSRFQRPLTKKFPSNRRQTSSNSVAVQTKLKNTIIPKKKFLSKNYIRTDALNVRRGPVRRGNFARFRQNTNAQMDDNRINRRDLHSNKYIQNRRPIASRLTHLDNQTPPRRKFNVRDSNFENRRQNDRDDNYTAQQNFSSVSNYNDESESGNGIYQNKNRILRQQANKNYESYRQVPRNMYNQSSNNFNNSNKPTVSSLNNNQTNEMYPFRYQTNFHHKRDNVRRQQYNSQKPMQKLNYNNQEQQRSSIHYNNQTHGNSKNNYQNKERFDNNVNYVQRYAPHQQVNVRTDIPPPNYVTQQPTRENAYMIDFPPLGALPEQNRINNQQRPNVYQQQSQAPLRQPTDVVYFDPNQQQQARITHKNFSQPRERKRLQIVPPNAQ